MDVATQNLFVPVQQTLNIFLSGTTIPPTLQYAPVTVSGGKNVFFGPRYSLGQNNNVFNSNRNTYVGVNAAETATTTSAASFTNTFHQNSVLVSNNFKLPPIGTNNTVIGNDIYWKFKNTDTSNVFIAPFTQNTFTALTAPEETTDTLTNCVVIGYPDKTLMASNRVLINCAKPVAGLSSGVATTSNVVLSIAYLTSADETINTFRERGIPLNGLYFNADTAELCIRLA
jgi:hypothetical protein